MIRTDYRDEKSLGYRMRKKRVRHLVNLIEKIILHHKLNEIRIADIGGNKTYWRIFPFERFPNVLFNIELININEQVMYLDDNLGYKNVRFFHIVGDCTRLEMKDNNYDLCHSNSVIEHVGSWVNVQKTVAESKRVAKYTYHQTPNFWFPVEPHFQLPLIHWLPRPVMTTLIRRFTKYKEYDGIKLRQDEICLLTFNDIKHLFPSDELLKERYLFVKSFMAFSKIRI